MGLCKAEQPASQPRARDRAMLLVVKQVKCETGPV
jgi:hypothetical protein